MTEPHRSPDHVEDTVQAIAQLHAEHRERATQADRTVARVTGAIVAPWFIAATLIAMLLWVAFNVASPALGLRPFDPYPFELLQGVATILALYVTVLIVATQHRDDQIISQREQLSLQLAMLNDRKLAKLIGLMEEMRRDDPSLRNRVDNEADEMAQPADHRVVLDALGEQCS
jgi:uncharacterized membrane protein